MGGSWRLGSLTRDSIAVVSCVGCEQGAYGGVYTATVVGSDRQFVVKVAYPDPDLNEEAYLNMGGEPAASRRSEKLLSTSPFLRCALALALALVLILTLPDPTMALSYPYLTVVLGSRVL